MILSRRRCVVRIPEDQGLHTREAISLSTFARRFPCELHLIYGEHEANAKDPWELIELDPEPGSEVVLEAEGEDSEQALDCLAGLMTHHYSRAWEDLAVLGLLSPESDGYRSLASLSPWEPPSPFGLPAHETEVDRSITRLSPWDSLAAFGLLSDREEP